MSRIAVLGAGAWGTALAAVLASRHDVRLWARDRAQAEAIARDRRNGRYLPEIPLPDSLTMCADASAALDGAALALVATTVAGLRETLGRVGRVPAVWLCKGMEAGSGLMPHQVAEQVLGAGVPFGALSGPSFALEVALGLPCALTLASRDAQFAREAAALVHGGRLRVYFGTDLAGVEVGGAVKNVMALAVGISDGLGLGQNARAALITRGLAEIARLGAALGAQPETLMGLAGAGDLILTATGDLSRNRRVGLELAQGKALDQVLAALGHVAEGVRTAAEVAKLARSRGVEMPITETVVEVLAGRLAPPHAVERLMARDARAEGAA
ncbi:MAG: NAD(P)H-dependent glycerol-3-phosphate dehydrogenase [Betaproteobacteria bacterium]